MIEGAFAEYLEDHVLVQWDSDLLEFLGRASETGNFLFLKDGTYHLHPVLLKALRRRAAKTLGSEVLKDHAYNAGLWRDGWKKRRTRTGSSVSWSGTVI